LKRSRIIASSIFVFSIFLMSSLSIVPQFVVFATNTHPRVQLSGSSATVSVPRGIIAYVQITISNLQSSPTPAPFQQEIPVDSSAYSSYENAGLQNTEFFNSRGTVVPSWLESGASSSSTFTVYWIKLRSAIPADGSTTVYLGFASKNANLFSKRIDGEAPSLSKTYGEYDDGASVFSYYTNFAGKTLPSSLAATELSFDACGSYSSGSYSVDQGLSVSALGSPSGGCGGGFFFDTVKQYSPSIAETDLVRQTGPSSVALESYYSAVEWDTTFPSSSYWGIESGYAFEYMVCGCGTQWQILEGNPNAAPGVVGESPASGAPPTGVYGIEWYNSGIQIGTQGYSQAFEASSTINPYQMAHAGFGYVNGEPTRYTAVFDWFRIRALPPNGVMPSLS
jgi:hypothetical protein